MSQTTRPELTGKNLVEGAWIGEGNSTFFAAAADTGETLSTQFATATAAEIGAACDAAEAAFAAFRNTSPQDRAAFLTAIAENIEANADAIIAMANDESGLGLPRLTGELGRTTGQLRMFAAVAQDDAWRQLVIDEALPDRAPAPRPELRRVMVAVGPVAVFAASNFPLAFSVAGGDTASALAVGCPVVVKAHESHPGTSELVAQAIDAAIESAGLARGVFSLLQGDGRTIAQPLVQHSAIASVAVTGSLTGGLAIRELAESRPVPIPVFAEMGSQNPVVVLPVCAASRGSEVAGALAASMTNGVGQFCTKPGIIFGVAGDDWTSFVSTFAEATSNVELGPMLNARMASSFESDCTNLAAISGVSTPLAPSISEAGPTRVTAAVFEVSLELFESDDRFESEVFGPTTLLVGCDSLAELERAVSELPGQLTATVHHDEGDAEATSRLVDTLGQIAGRVLLNGVPTGVEVAAAMQHGGPFPATTDARFTSVGAASYERFVRPVCFQNVPETLLPAYARS